MCDHRFELVTRRTIYLHDEDEHEFRRLMDSTRKPKVAWDTAPTGQPHIGYLIPLLKIIDFARAGLEPIVYLGDVYAFLINHDQSMDVVRHRADYYHLLIENVLEVLGLPPSAVTYVKESTITKTPDWFFDVQKMSVRMTQDDARDATEETKSTRMLSPLLCAIQQTLSEQYLDLDIQFGGIDQANLFLHAECFLPKIGYRKRLHLMNPLLKGLDGTKMSSSKKTSTKIMLLDSEAALEAKIDAAHCPERQVDGNGILGILEHILFPISQYWKELGHGQVHFDGCVSQDTWHAAFRQSFVGEEAPLDSLFAVNSGPSHGLKFFASYRAVEDAFVQGEISSVSLKAATFTALNRVLRPIREAYNKDAQWKALEVLAY